MNRRLIDFGMSLPPERRLARPLSAEKIAALRRATEASRTNPPRGEKNPAAKLTEAQVRKIRELRAAGERPVTLAARFGVERTLIWYIVNRKIWAHV